MKNYGNYTPFEFDTVDKWKSSWLVEQGSKKDKEMTQKAYFCSKILHGLKIGRHAYRQQSCTVNIAYLHIYIYTSQNN